MSIERLHAAPVAGYSRTRIHPPPLQVLEMAECDKHEIQWLSIPGYTLFVELYTPLLQVAMTDAVRNAVKREANNRRVLVEKKVVAAEEAARTWGCPTCTLQNLISRPRCEACGGGRPSSAHPDLNDDKRDEEIAILAASAAATALSAGRMTGANSKTVAEVAKEAQQAMAFITPSRRSQVRTVWEWE